MKRVDVKPSLDGDEVMFTIHRSNDLATYWKPWWSAHLHVLKLIFTGHDIHYVEPAK